VKKSLTYSGSIIDATFMDIPRQRNSRSENKTIKEGGIPEEWGEVGKRNKAYPLLAVIGITLLTVMAFAEGGEDIEKYGKAKEGGG
jgi:hypothetical protein